MAVFVFVIVFVDKGTTSIFAFPTKCNRLQQTATEISQATLFQWNKFLTQVRGAALSGARKVVCRSASARSQEQHQRRLCSCVSSRRREMSVVSRTSRGLRYWRRRNLQVPRGVLLLQHSEGSLTSYRDDTSTLPMYWLRRYSFARCVPTRLLDVLT